MLTVLSKEKYTQEEYYELERNSEEKLEFYDGSIRPFAGSSLIHEEIVMNTGAHLNNLLRGRKCGVYFSRLKLKVPSFGPYRYADLSCLCGEPIVEIIGEMEVVTNPQLIVEVLEPETEVFDRGQKFEFYKSIPSFSEYLLIAANRPLVTRLTKTNEGDWIAFEADELKFRIPLPTFGIQLSMSEIYRGVDFRKP